MSNSLETSGAIAVLKAISFDSQEFLSIVRGISHLKIMQKINSITSCLLLKNLISSIKRFCDPFSHITRPTTKRSKSVTCQIKMPY
jgi:hypothetical protein